jgi:hypothetical protein
VKDSLTKELERNQKEWDNYTTIRDKAMLEFAEIMRHLNEPSLSISQLTCILGIKPTTVLNWDIRVTRRFKVPKPKKKKWRRFSFLDLFGFMILKELKKRGVIIERTMNLFWNIKNDFCQFDSFVLWAKGFDIFIIYDFDKAEVISFSNLHSMWDQLKRVAIERNFYVSAPFGCIIRELLETPELQKCFNPAFRIRVLKDKKLSITINNKESIMKDMPDKPDS